ncbi:MAG TPA: hypothetical protein VH189_06075, partial [Rhizomicrobium sp.]|nr:hypothetical protein [Rhizomicrobium sp.]
VTTEALRCNNLADDRQWLDCYYGAAQPVRAQLGLSPATQVQAGAPMPASGAGSNSTRVFPPSGRVAAPLEQSASTTRNPGWLQVASYSFNRNGIFTIFLANGQQWRQLSGDTSLAHWTKPAAHYWVRITRGALRSLNLKVKGESAAYKVELSN